MYAETPQTKEPNIKHYKPQNTAARRTVDVEHGYDVELDVVENCHHTWIAVGVSLEQPTVQGGRRPCKRFV